jgi:PAS domain S-box-containing protein
LLRLGSVFDLRWPTGRSILVVLGSYLLVASAWVVAGTLVLRAGGLDRDQIIVVEALEGGLFVLSTGVLLYFLLRRELGRNQAIDSELRRADHLWRGVLDALNDAVFVSDGRTHSLLYCNTAAERLTGHPAAELVGRTAEPLLGEAFAETARAVDEAVRRQGHYRGEAWVETGNGHRRRVEMFVAPLGDATDANPVRVSVVRDVTEERRQEEMFSAVLANVTELVTVLDRDARVVYASPSCATVLGYDVEEIEGRVAFELVHPEEREMAGTVFERAVTRPEGKPVELRLLRSDGTYASMEVIGTPARGAPEPAALVVTGRDVTARKAAQQALVEREEQLRQAQKLESVGRLAGGVAHDFNNLLTVILGYGEILGEQAPELSAELDEIVKAGQHGAALTRQLLAFSRQQVLRPRIVNLNAIVEETRRMLERVIGEDVELRVELDRQLGKVMADPVQVQQVLLNLAVNARDAMPSGGALEISTRRTWLDRPSTGSVGEKGSGWYAGLVVEDSGVGMSEETRRLAFDPFFTTKDPHEGTGLGLATVYGIVTQSGGTIELESAPGEGTRFTILLPQVDEVEAEREADVDRAPVTPVPGSGTVLLVEDDERIRRLSQRVLEKAGYRVVAAGDAEEALRHLRLEPEVDLLLTDVVLPGTSGPQLAETALRGRPGLRVLFMSGYAPEIIVRRGFVEPGTRVLEKPFTGAELRQCVGDALRDRD